MIEVYGRYNTALVFTDELEDAARAQILMLCGQAFCEGSKIRNMPDVHAGAGCTTGTTMTIGDKVCPNLVGVDNGCGMETVRLDARRLEWTKLDKVIRERIPSGFGVRGTAHALAEEIDLSALRWKKGLNLDRTYRSIGTLGGGNHFIEVDKGEDDALYLVVHSGSRHLGLEIAKVYLYQRNQLFRTIAGSRAELPADCEGIGLILLICLLHGIIITDAMWLTNWNLWSIHNEAILYSDR